MAVDRGYGSGKPRSAANSRARQRVAKGQMTKGKKGNAALKKIAAENPVTGFIGGGVAISKVLGAANSMRAAGQGLFPATRALASRAAAKQIGQSAARNIAQSRSLAQTASEQLYPVARMLPTMFKTEAKAAGGVARGGARSLYPQAEMAAQEARLAKARLAAAKRANRNR